MGLFDIFRRKSKQKKEEAPESAASENAEKPGRCQRKYSQSKHGC